MKNIRNIFFLSGNVCLSILMVLMGYPFTTPQFWFALGAYGCLYLSKKS